MQNRDKFLTEAMGECWHEGWRSFGYRDEIECDKCGRDFYDNADFSTWEGFGKLWEWAQEQEWWLGFKRNQLRLSEIALGCVMDYSIHPDRFADALYEFLKSRNQ